MTKKLGAWAASSEDPEKVANRIKGVILACSALIIYGAARFLHIDLKPEDVVQLATQLGTLGGLMWSVYGAGLALFRWVAEARH